MVPRTFAVVIPSVLLAALGPAGLARADEPEASPAPVSDVTADATDTFLATYAPAPVDAPALRLPVTTTRLYLDATYATTDDLSVLPFIAGKGRNVRFALGGAWRWRRFAFTGEMPFEQVSTIDVTQVFNDPMGVFPEDKHQTAIAPGDFRAGADWSDHLSPSVVAGFGMRVRFPTHTTRFQFHQADGSLETYRFPYFFHFEPTGILGVALGRLALVVNEGAILFAGPDGDFGGMHFVEPNIVFWDAHYAASYAFLDALAASVELVTDVQLNHVGGLDFQRLNDVRSVWIAPGLQVHFGDYRLDAVARFGLTRGAEFLGVIEYAGTRSYTLRVSRTF